MKENSFARFILVLLAVIALWCIAIFHFDTETESNTEKIQGKLERLDLDQKFGRNSFAQFWINGRAYYCLLPSRQDRRRLGRPARYFLMLRPRMRHLP